MVPGLRCECGDPLSVSHILLECAIHAPAFKRIVEDFEGVEAPVTLGTLLSRHHKYDWEIAMRVVAKLADNPRAVHL